MSYPPDPAEFDRRVREAVAALSEQQRERLLDQHIGPTTNGAPVSAEQRKRDDVYIFDIMSMRVRQADEKRAAQMDAKRTKAKAQSAPPQTELPADVRKHIDRMPHGLLANMAKIDNAAKYLSLPVKYSVVAESLDLMRDYVDRGLANITEKLASLEQLIADFEYRGVWSAGENYRKGNSVTFGGGVWMCRHTTLAKPGESDDWQLAVKRGEPAKARDVARYLIPEVQRALKETRDADRA
jgi:hypothetical protein